MESGRFGSAIPPRERHCAGCVGGRDDDRELLEQEVARILARAASGVPSYVRVRTSVTIRRSTPPRPIMTSSLW
jgi:hypothetical protein